MASDSNQPHFRLALSIQCYTCISQQTTLSNALKMIRVKNEKQTQIKNKNVILVLYNTNSFT